VERFLSAEVPGTLAFEQAGTMAADSFTEVCGWRHSSPYKVPAIGRMVARVLEEAWQRLGGQP
jgi:hypothetical protein